MRYTDGAGNRQVYSDQVVLDTTPPRILRTELSPEGKVRVVLSEPVRPESLEVVAISSGGRTVLGRWSYVRGNTEAVFKPEARHRGSLTLRIPEMLDEAGNRLLEPFEGKIR